MGLVERLTTKIRLKMQAWLGTVFLIGSLLILMLHQFGYKQEETVLNTLVVGMITYITALFGTELKKENNDNTPQLHSVCENCGKLK